MKDLVFGKMSLVSRVLMAIAALLLSLTFFFPMWSIHLWAPQYPEGLSMFIWAHKLSGDIQTVNILNHYVGMAHIDESMFPELKIFPVVFSVLLGTGLLAAIVGRKVLAQLWTLGILSFALSAMLSFYNWEYKFGHELNSDAPIKMEDMVYQPPLIGEKLFLNISASSWPSWAGIAFALAVLLGCAAILIDFKQKKA